MINFFFKPFKPSPERCDNNLKKLHLYFMFIKIFIPSQGIYPSENVYDSLYNFESLFFPV